MHSRPALFMSLMIVLTACGGRHGPEPTARQAAEPSARQAAEPPASQAFDAGAGAQTWSSGYGSGDATHLLNRGIGVGSLGRSGSPPPSGRGDGSRSRARIERLEVDGALAADDVRKSVQGYLRQLSICWDFKNKDLPPPEGEITFRFKVDPRGDVDLQQSRTALDAPFARCLEQSVRGFKFSVPLPEGATANVELVLRLTVPSLPSTPDGGRP